MDLLLKAAKGELDKVGELQWSEDMAINVVVAADGYPGSYAKGEMIGASTRPTLWMASRCSTLVPQ